VAARLQSHFQRLVQTDGARAVAAADFSLSLAASLKKTRAATAVAKRPSNSRRRRMSLIDERPRPPLMPVASLGGVQDWARL